MQLAIHAIHGLSTGVHRSCHVLHEHEFVPSDHDQYYPWCDSKTDAENLKRFIAYAKPRVSGDETTLQMWYSCKLQAVMLGVNIGVERLYTDTELLDKFPEVRKELTEKIKAIR